MIPFLRTLTPAAPLAGTTLGNFDRADALSPERPAEIRVIRQETRPEHEETTIYADLNENAEVMDITCLPDWSDGTFWRMFIPTAPMR